MRMQSSLIFERHCNTTVNVKLLNKIFTNKPKLIVVLFGSEIRY